MKLVLRLLWLVFTQRFRSRCSVMGPVDTQLRVFPNDLDVFMHVNNGVFLTYADLGRTDLLLRSDIFHPMRKRGWYPVIATQTIQFKQSLLLGQRFSINTRVLGWSEKAIYIEQLFTRGDKLIAQAMIDARFLKKTGGRVSHDELFELMGTRLQSPPFPKRLELWIASNQATIESASANKEDTKSA